MTLTFDFFKLKIGTPVTPAVVSVHINLGFSTHFCFRVRSPYGTDRRTDGRTRPAMRPVGRLHNDALIHVTRSVSSSVLGRWRLAGGDGGGWSSPNSGKSSTKFHLRLTPDDSNSVHCIPFIHLK